MTSEVVTAVSDMPTREIARLLSRHGISALPVVDAFGAPIGMVSEGDLIGRIGIDRDMRRDWWLTLFSEAPMLSADSVLALAKLFVKLRVREKRACEIMSAPLITVGETADEQEIAGLLTAHHIKRVPVVRDGKLVGIVSRADLIRAMASKTTRQSINSSQRGLFGMIFDGLDRRFADSQEERPAIAPAAVEPQTTTADAKLDASDFRNLVAGFEKKQSLHHDEEHRVAVKQHQEMVKQLLDEHISDERWRGIMHEAREAAARGEKQYMLLRFPASLCSDQGRSINALNQSADWTETLRGEAAEFYQYWKRDLQPYGFRLGAWVLDFPGGIPGDIGLFLMWGG